MRFAAVISLLLFSMLISPVLARDVAGGRDHELVGRYEGATMTLYKTRDYEEQRLLVKPIRSADLRAAGRRLSDANSLSIAGKAYRIRYQGPAGRSALEVARNFHAELKAKGFETLFECRGRDCSDAGGSELYFALHDESPMGTGDIHSSPETQVFASMKRSRPEGDVYVSVYVIDFAKMPEVLVDVTETQPMENDKIVFIDAAEMERQIAQNGRVSLYGILFDFDKATIKPESQPTLDEIVRLLKSATELKLVVAGHTDAKGGFDYNIDLSKRRAEAVVAAIAKAGIAMARLKPFGVGMAAPVASNDSEAGRAKNRRVELVKAGDP